MTTIELLLLTADLTLLLLASIATIALLRVLRDVGGSAPDRATHSPSVPDEQTLETGVFLPDDTSSVSREWSDPFIGGPLPDGARRVLESLYTGVDPHDLAIGPDRQPVGIPPLHDEDIPQWTPPPPSGLPPDTSTQKEASPQKG